MAKAKQPEPTCAELIGQHLTGRLADFATLTKAMNLDDDDLDTITDEELSEITNERTPDRAEWTADKLRELAQERQNELPLSVEKLTVVKVLLSTGGPADWFEASCDTDGTITRIEYVYQDWFDGARRTLAGDEFKTAEAFLQDYVNIATENY